MLKRTRSLLAAGAVLAASALTAPSASAELIDNNYNFSQVCQELRSSFTTLSSTQETTTPYVAGTNMTTASDKVGTHLSIGSSFQVNPGGGRTTPVKLNWEWTEHIRRAVSLTELAVKNGCGAPYTHSQFERKAIQAFNAGLTANQFMNSVSVSMDSHLYKSKVRVPNFIHLENRSISVSPSSPDTTQDKVYNLVLKTRYNGSDGPKYVYPIRVIQLPDGSGRPTEVEENYESNAFDLFGGLFSFSS